MNVLRQILCLKTITIIALATFFISTMSIREAQPGHRVICPCHFFSATFTAKRQVKKIGGQFEIDTCTDTLNVEVVAEGESATCRIELEVEENSENECGYEFQCPVNMTSLNGITNGEIDIDDDEFVLAFDLDGLSTAEIDACRQQVIFISEFIFNTPCT
ncbi:hypothetical protein MYX76_18100 [Desulfobacterota bacterium AH_259_B03_O07]|nr:hypothetical protein [Desulfobacterota bacterium AH_259_B03_O07]